MFEFRPQITPNASMFLSVRPLLAHKLQFEPPWALIGCLFNMILSKTMQNRKSALKAEVRIFEIWDPAESLERRLRIILSYSTALTPLKNSKGPTGWNSEISFCSARRALSDGVVSLVTENFALVEISEIWQWSKPFWNTRIAWYVATLGIITCFRPFANTLTLHILYFGMRWSQFPTLIQIYNTVFS